MTPRPGAMRWAARFPRWRPALIVALVGCVALGLAWSVVSLWRQSDGHWQNVARSVSAHAQLEEQVATGWRCAAAATPNCTHDFDGLARSVHARVGRAGPGRGAPGCAASRVRDAGLGGAGRPRQPASRDAIRRRGPGLRGAARAGGRAECGRRRPAAPGAPGRVGGRPRDRAAVDLRWVSWRRCCSAGSPWCGPRRQ